MFEQLDQRSKEPFHIRARRYLVDYRKQFPGLALILVLIYLELGLIGAPFGFRSSFDGVWLAERPSGKLPGSIAVQLKNGNFPRRGRPSTATTRRLDSMSTARSTPGQSMDWRHTAPIARPSRVRRSKSSKKRGTGTCPSNDGRFRTMAID